MEKKIIYLKLFQIVLTLTIIWQLISMRQFCGTFADPKTFLCGISAGDRYTLIGKDAETGEFVSVYDKLHNQFFTNRTNSTQCQFIRFLIARLPPAGRNCIPITISPFDWLLEWIGKDTNPLDNGTLFYFSVQLFIALCSLVVCFGGFMRMLHSSVKEYKFPVCLGAFGSVIGWCFCAAISSNLLLHWTDFWIPVNFRADHTNVPLAATLVISIVMVCLSIFEIVLHKFVLNDVVDTECAIVLIHQKQKSGSAFM